MGSQVEWEKSLILKKPGIPGKDELALLRIAFIVATKDRPEDLRRLLASLERQTAPPAQVVVVDGGTQSAAEVVRRVRGLNVRYVTHFPPSAAGQRNRGIREADSGLDLLGFLDDDTEFVQEAMERMADFWKTVPPDVGGAAFNLINHPPIFAAALKYRPWVERLGLYSSRPGIVLPSGFHTMIGSVRDNTEVQWIPTTAAVWRRRVLEEFPFDEWYRGYGYIEDLDFSYRAGKKYRLTVVAGARYYHYPSVHSRVDHYSFGKKEVVVRLYYVRKHPELSPGKCALALAVRMLISLNLAVRERKIGYLRRAVGNLVGLARAFRP